MIKRTELLKRLRVGETYWFSEPATLKSIEKAVQEVEEERKRKFTIIEDNSLGNLKAWNITRTK